MRIDMGSWRCPSGNTCDAVLIYHDKGRFDVYFCWDSPPPLTEEDESYYQAVIIPQLVARARVYVQQEASCSATAKGGAA